jgi:hypothetical protein
MPDRQLKVRVDADLAEAFKKACQTDGVSMAAEISRFMRMKVGSLKTAGTPPPVATRQQRRREVDALRARAQRVLDAEERYRDNIPENLQGSKNYEAAEMSIEALDGVIEALEAVFE